MNQAICCNILIRSILSNHPDELNNLHVEKLTLESIGSSGIELKTI